VELAQQRHNRRLLEQRLILTRQWKYDLRRCLLKHDWVTSKTMQVLRRRPTEPYGEAIPQRIQRAASGDPP